MEIIKSNSLKRKFIFVLIVFFAGIVNSAFSQIPASLEKELFQFNSDIYDAIKLINTQNEKDVVAKLVTVKPQLIQRAKSLSEKISKIPELSETEENAYMEKILKDPLFKEMMALMSSPSFLKKIENSQVLKKEYEELMTIMDLGTDSKQEPDMLSGSQVCSFVVGPGSPYTGSYTVTAAKEEAFAYNDVENEQFVIEITGENINVMLIVEKPVPGKHTFTMEMQVAIDIRKNNADDYDGFDNYQEEGGGYIQIDRIDDNGGIVSGSFSGKFNDSSTADLKPVQIDGKFSVQRI